MPINIRFVDDVAILSNIGRMMNDPRYVDAGKDVRDLLDQGYRKFVIELGGVKETGSPLMGLLMTLTRQVRQRGGEVVLANLSRGMEAFIDKMQLEDYWDIFESAEEARGFFPRELS